MEVFVIKLKKIFFYLSKKSSKGLKSGGVLGVGLVTFFVVTALVISGLNVARASNTYGYPERSTYGYPKYQSFGYPARSSSSSSENLNKDHCNHRLSNESNIARRFCFNEVTRDSQKKSTQVLEAKHCKHDCMTKESLDKKHPSGEFQINNDQMLYKKDLHRYRSPRQSTFVSSRTGPSSGERMSTSQSQSETTHEYSVQTEVVDESSDATVSGQPSTLVPELPKTGNRDNITRSLGAGGLVAALYAYIRSKRAMSKIYFDY